jgi:hypothetical protein
MGKSKYEIKFKMTGKGQTIHLSCGADDIKDVNRKLRIFKQKGMPWAHDFKLYRIADGGFVRDL